MREIRIWDGQKYHYPEANENETNHHLQIGSNGFFSLWDGEGNFITSSEKGGIIEWSTGLIDKNKNKVFEGDILGMPEHPRERWSGNVYYKEGGFYITPNGAESSLNSYRAGRSVIIGNIHESLTPNK
ncbi:TPA: hypothetical protein JRX02_002945 [Elizabethkingia anophelis]|uniref:YopX family protein n=1 Tax=Elizabethkingia anophelis TaxID=1117645 RepID=UPI00296DC53E|nr:hypothetical protein [Elizabethkingia anophelis]HAY3504319.1 hypothetical protein [Elizabethkingia anophelis]HAY3512296.1 hypothetical protein [Elizabethkingia anophelis]HAY3516548.1 hypothetical protein [Elizabethkingia anophelis]HAY3520413.1 hypothetical protein [Elizabethkingia anophelis]